MTKKRLFAGILVGAGLIFLVSGISAMGNTSGYDAYKAALINTKAAASLTADADLVVTDNGTEVFAGKATIKLNHERNAGSVAATVGSGGETQNLNVYRQDGKVIFKSSADDVYRVMEQDGSKWRRNGYGQMQRNKAAEKMFDALMGNMKELATVEAKPDGSQEASLHVSGRQIPAVIQAIGTMVVTNHAGGREWHHASWNEDEGPFFAPDLKANLPQLADDFKVEAVNLDAKISPDNQLVGQSAEIHLSGSDPSGKLHALVIRLHVEFSGFNQTTPDRVDLTGKQTAEIQKNWSDRDWHR